MTGVVEALGAAVAVGAGLPEDPALDGVVDVVLAGPGKAERHVTLEWRAGRLVAARDEAPADAALTLTVTADDLPGLLDGSVAPSVAFMRGRLKTAGDPGLVLRLLAAVEGGPFERWRTTGDHSG